VKKFLLVTLKYLFAFFPIVFTLALAKLRFANFPFYSSLIKEDGLFEYSQSIFFLLASGLFGLMFVKTTDKYLIIKIFSLVLAIGLFFMAGEEISWGQRLSDLNSPNYFLSHNIQSEITVHNLGGIQPLLAWGYFLGGLVIGLISLIWPKLARVLLKTKLLSRKIMAQLSIFVPNHWLVAYFLPVSAIYMVLMFYQPYGVILKRSHIVLMTWQDQELGETVMALGIFCYALSIVFRKRL